jgi:hypothetical protein
MEFGHGPIAWGVATEEPSACCLYRSSLQTEPSLNTHTLWLLWLQRVVSYFQDTEYSWAVCDYSGRCRPRSLLLNTMLSKWTPSTYSHPTSSRCTMLQAGRSRDRVPMRWIFSDLPNPSGRTMALGSTQPLTEMSTRNLKKETWG